MVELIDENEVNLLSLRKKDNRFYLYKKVIEQYIPYFQEEIKSSEHGRILIRYNVMTKMLGDQFGHLGYKAIYNGIKFVLLRHDIYVQLGTNTDREKVFILRRRRVSDIVSPTYQDIE